MRMAWTRVDDKFLMNPKVQSVGVHGMALYISGLIYCNANLTDGFISNSMLPVLCGLAFQVPPQKTSERLVQANLWERVEGGFRVHDFLHFNKSKQEIELLNHQRAINGSKGGRKPSQAAPSAQPAQQDAKQTGSDMLNTPPGKQPPINPNTLIPNTLIPETHTIKPPPATREALLGSIFKSYEGEIGSITPSIADDIKTAMEVYPSDWFEEAFREAARNNKRNWRYALAILKRWKVEGFQMNSGKGLPKPAIGSYEAWKNVKKI